MVDPAINPDAMEMYADQELCSSSLRLGRGVFRMETPGSGGFDLAGCLIQFQLKPIKHLPEPSEKTLKVTMVVGSSRVALQDSRGGILEPAGIVEARDFFCT